MRVLQDWSAEVGGRILLMVYDNWSIRGARCACCECLLKRFAGTCVGRFEIKLEAGFEG